MVKSTAVGLSSKVSKFSLTHALFLLSASAVLCQAQAPTAFADGVVPAPAASPTVPNDNHHCFGAAGHAGHRSHHHRSRSRSISSHLFRRFGRGLRDSGGFLRTLRSLDSRLFSLLCCQQALTLCLLAVCNLLQALPLCLLRSQLLRHDALPLGGRVGCPVGCCDGCCVGWLVGTLVGCIVGWRDGVREGCLDGWPDGCVGILLGIRDGCLLGC
jgi:hypothetical protein